MKTITRRENEQGNFSWAKRGCPECVLPGSIPETAWDERSLGKRPEVEGFKHEDRWRENLTIPVWKKKKMIKGLFLFRSPCNKGSELPLFIICDKEEDDEKKISPNECRETAGSGSTGCFAGPGIGA